MRKKYDGEQIAAYRREGKTFKEIAELIGGAPEHSLRRAFQEHLKRKQPTRIDAVGLAMMMIANASRRTRIETREADKEQLSASFSKLSKISYKRMAKIAVLSDEHIPDHDPIAIDLAAQFCEWYQPDLIVINGDTFDFKMLSRFPPSDREDYDDAFDEVRKPYWDYIDKLKAATNADLILIDGNHNARARAFANMNKVFGNTIEREYWRLVRYQGRVLHIPAMQELQIGPLLVKHHSRTTIHSAKTTLDGIGAGISVVGGHVHRFTKWYQIQRYFDSRTRILCAATTGCLCNIPPHWMRNETNYVNWMKGLLYANIDFNGDLVVLNEVVFHEKGSKLIASVGKRTFLSRG